MTLVPYPYWNLKLRDDSNILDMMSFIKTPKAIDELNDILSDYFSKRLDEEINKLWTEGTLTENKVESFRHLHERTTYPY